MVHVKPFAVEQWMDAHENNCTHNLAETCCASISLSTLHSLSDDRSQPVLDIHTRPLTYGAIRGCDALRGNLAALYSSRSSSIMDKESVIITPGAIAANFLVMYALVGKGDHVIVHYPTYQQLYAVPEALGAEVTLWRAKEEKGWQLDVEELEGLIKPNTKLVVLNNPNNPTGSILPRPTILSIATLTTSKQIPLLIDEVYRPLFHSIFPTSPDFPPSILSLPSFPLTLATGSLSKAYSLAGIRVGWVASRSPELMEKIAKARDYTTISVSQVDEMVAAFALRETTIHNLLARNIKIAKMNLAALETFIHKHKDNVSWVKPVAGTTAFVKFTRGGKPVDGKALCERILKEVGVLLVPGKECFGEGKDFEGYVRFGYCPEITILEDGLKKLEQFMGDGGGFEAVPLGEE